MQLVTSQSVPHHAMAALNGGSHKTVAKHAGRPATVGLGTQLPTSTFSEQNSLDAVPTHRGKIILSPLHLQGKARGMWANQDKSDTW